MKKELIVIPDATAFKRIAKGSERSKSSLLSVLRPVTFKDARHLVNWIRRFVELNAPLTVVNSGEVEGCVTTIRCRDKTNLSEAWWEKIREAVESDSFLYLQFADDDNMEGERFTYTVLVSGN